MDCTLFSTKIKTIKEVCAKNQMLWADVKPYSVETHNK